MLVFLGGDIVLKPQCRLKYPEMSGKLTDLLVWIAQGELPGIKSLKLGCVSTYDLTHGGCHKNKIIQVV